MTSTQNNRKKGRVYVAKYYPGKPLPDAPPGVKNVFIHTKSTGLGGALSPYVLKNEDGCLLENVWQFSKLYSSVTAQKTKLSRYHPNTIIWEHPSEVHVDSKTGLPNEAYWEWREKGMKNEYAVRYPNGFYGRHKCICAIWGDDNRQLDYISARKEIYCGEYARLLPKEESFKKMRSLLKNGVDLQIVEVDGPDPKLTHAPYDQISMKNPGLLITEDTIRLLVNDPARPFGHGFVIATLLLKGKKWLK